MSTRPGNSETLVFLLDVDNTLLNNDQLKSDVGRDICRQIGPELENRFWKLYEEVREDEGFVDYPRTVELLARERNDPTLGHELDEMIRGYQFRRYLYPHALETISHLKTMGTVVILSDGDSVFQPLKIRDSGLEEAVDGRVLIYVHKERELPRVFAAYPADHYVMVDDKPSILAALEETCPARFTTVLVLQGHYAGQASDVSPKPDYAVRHIGDLRHFSRPQFLEPSRVGEARLTSGRHDHE